MEKNNDLLITIAKLTQQLEQNPECEEVRRERCNLFLQMGLLKEAAEDLDALKELNPVELMARVQIYLIENNPRKAEEILWKSNEKHPESKTEYMLLSQIFSAQKKYPEALDILQKGMEHITVFPEAYKERGRIRMLLNDSKGAMDDLKKALEQDPEMLDDLNGELTNK